MSLNYQLGDITNYKEVCMDANKEIKPATKSIMFIGMIGLFGHITDTNHEEVFKRIHIYERSRGAFHETQEGPMYVTLAEVKAHIGLRTNVSTESNAKFDKNMMRVLREDAVEELNRQKRL